MARKIPNNWLSKFSDWCSPRSESPYSFIFWAGLFTLAAATRKHVYLPKSILGSYDLYPNLYIVFVAPPGIRKTTTMGFADEILGMFDPKVLPSSPTIITQAALMVELVESKDNSIYITASELASLVQKSKTDMFEFLTDAYDCKKSIKARTIGRGVEEAKKPCLNLLACTQPVWVAENIPPSVIGGGFASRVIFVYEQNPRRRQMYYRELNHDILAEYKNELIEDLAHIAMIEGEFDITEEAELWMEQYYVDKSALIKTKDPRLQGYFERKSIHIHKVAMLMSISYKDDLVLTKTDFESAIKVLDMIEPNMLQVFSHIGKNTYTADIDNIRDFIISRGKVARSDVFRTFQANAQPAVLDELINALKVMGYIQEILDNGVSFYRGVTE